MHLINFDTSKMSVFQKVKCMQYIAGLQNVVGTGSYNKISLVGVGSTVKGSNFPSQVKSHITLLTKHTIILRRIRHIACECVYESGKVTSYEKKYLDI